jgi:hypothetical protein
LSCSGAITCVAVVWFAQDRDRPADGAVVDAVGRLPRTRADRVVHDQRRGQVAATAREREQAVVGPTSLALAIVAAIDTTAGLSAMVTVAVEGAPIVYAAFGVSV